MKRADLARAVLLARALDDWAAVETELAMRGRVVEISVGKLEYQLGSPNAAGGVSVVVPIEVGRNILAGVRKLLDAELRKAGVTP